MLPLPFESLSSGSILLSFLEFVFSQNLNEQGRLYTFR